MFKRGLYLGFYSILIVNIVSKMIHTKIMKEIFDISMNWIEDITCDVIKDSLIRIRHKSHFGHWFK